MSVEIIVETTNDASSRRRYSYDENESVIVGSQSDCEIVLQDFRVSSYHCLLEITPPEIKLRDFGSQSGTYHISAGESIVASDETKLQQFEVITLSDGDTVLVGSACALRIHKQADQADHKFTLTEEHATWNNNELELNTERFKPSLHILLQRTMERTQTERLQQITETDLIYTLLTYEADTALCREFSKEEQQAFFESRDFITKHLKPEVQLTDCVKALSVSTARGQFPINPFLYASFSEPLRSWIDELFDQEGILELLQKIFCGLDVSKSGELLKKYLQVEELKIAINREMDLAHLFDHRFSLLIMSELEDPIDRANLIAMKMGTEQILPIHLLAASLTFKESYVYVLLGYGEEGSIGPGIATYLNKALRMDLLPETTVRLASRESFSEEALTILIKAKNRETGTHEIFLDDRKLILELLDCKDIKTQYFLKKILMVHQAYSIQHNADSIMEADTHGNVVPITTPEYIAGQLVALMRLPVETILESSSSKEKTDQFRVTAVNGSQTIMDLLKQAPQIRKEPENRKISKCVGIDFGTTNSVIAMLTEDNENFATLTDRTGSKKYPSVIVYDEKTGGIKTGPTAANRLGTSPKPIVSIRRHMGEASYKAACGPLNLTPAEVSAEILRAMKEAMQDYLNKIPGYSDCVVDRAVITTPIAFSARARGEILLAAKMAGLKAEFTLQEPIASALYYCFRNKIDGGIFMVYDLGGDTFDVSIVRIAQGDGVVLGFAGNDYLGGHNFDDALAHHLLKLLQDPDEGYDLDLDVYRNGDDRLRFIRLEREAEIIKKALTNKYEHFENADGLFKDKSGASVNLAASVTREGFEEMIRPFLEITIEECNKALKAAEDAHGVTLDMLDGVLLVGGSTYIPAVSKIIEKTYTDPGLSVHTKMPKPLKDEPDMAVGYGAAIAAARCGGVSAGEKVAVHEGRLLQVSASFEPGRGYAGASIVKGSLIAVSGTLPDGIKAKVRRAAGWFSKEFIVKADGSFVFDSLMAPEKKEPYVCEFFIGNTLILSKGFDAAVSASGMLADVIQQADFIAMNLNAEKVLPIHLLAACLTFRNSYGYALLNDDRKETINQTAAYINQAFRMIEPLTMVRFAMNVRLSKEARDILMKTESHTIHTSGSVPNDRQLILELIDCKDVKVRHFIKKVLLADQAYYTQSMIDTESEPDMQDKADPIMTPEYIAEQLLALMGLSTGVIRANGTRKDYEFLLKRFASQDAAMNIVATRLDLIQLGMVNQEMPAAVFTFAGLPGTGKKELAKQIARVYSKTGQLIYYDMATFVTPQSISRLIGVPKGYDGYENGGKLISELNENPYSVVLLDNIEKAHPDVWYPFIGLFDEGAIMDMREVSASPSKTIFILTTNIGQFDIVRMYREGIHQREIHNEVVQKLLGDKDHKASEGSYWRSFVLTIMRGGGIVPFNELSLEMLDEIARNMFVKQAEKYRAAYGGLMICDDDVIEMFVKRVFEDNEKAVQRGYGYLGGHELNLLMNQYIENKIASYPGQLTGVPLVKIIKNGEDTSVAPVYSDADVSAILEEKHRILMERIARMFNETAMV